MVLSPFALLFIRRLERKKSSWKPPDKSDFIEFDGVILQRVILQIKKHVKINLILLVVLTFENRSATLSF